jgi:Signal transduction histidine kinase involved in nitrogen fixation and metabolism regulation
MGTDIEDLGKLPLKSQDELNTINEMYKTITEQNTQLLALYDSGEIDQGLALANGDIENNAVKMRTAINTIIDRAQTRAENKHSSTISLVKQQKTLALIMSILVLLLTMVLCLALTRSIKRPLDEMERAAKQLAEGDLSQDITYESKDELGVLASGLRNTIAAMCGKEIAENGK